MILRRLFTQRPTERLLGIRTPPDLKRLLLLILSLPIAGIIYTMISLLTIFTLLI